MINNPYITVEFEEYLLAAGFREPEFTPLGYDVVFYKDDDAILIKNDRIEFMKMTEEEPGERSACLSHYMSFSGFSQLDTFKWMMLMHITGYVPFKDVVAAAKKDAENKSKVHPLFEDLFDKFGFTDKKTQLATL